MARSKGISGLGVAIVGGGTYLVYASVKDVPLLDGLRQIVRGQTPGAAPKDPSQVSLSDDIREGLAQRAGITAGLAGAPTPGVAGSVGATDTGGALLGAAQKYLGWRYRWGGTFADNRGGDCSGLVYRAFIDIGVSDCPRTSLMQSRWRKVRKVSRAQVRAGDLMYWPGHIGIASDGLNMINAPRPGRTVEYHAIDSGGSIPGPPTLCLRYGG